MQYVRTFHIQSAHFNSRSSYELVWQMVDAIEMKAQPAVKEPSLFDVAKAMRDIHGHNFKIVVALSGECDDEGWLVDDVALENVIKEWDGVNLSMHPDFIGGRERATTELMAEKLLNKIRKMLDSKDRAGQYDVTCTSVVVHENELIWAAANYD